MVSKNTICLWYDGNNNVEQDGGGGLMMVLDVET